MEYNMSLYLTSTRQGAMEYLNSKLSTRTIVLALTVTCLALVATQSVSAVETMEIGEDGLPMFLTDGEGNDNLEMLTFFTFFLGYIAMGAAFVFFIVERNNVAPEYKTTMTISALIVGIAAFHYYYMRGVYAD